MKNNLLFGFDMVLIVATVVFCVMAFQSSMEKTYQKMYDESIAEQQEDSVSTSNSIVN